VESNYKNSNGDKIGIALRAIDDNGHFRAQGIVWDQSISESDDRSDVYGSAHVDDGNWHHYTMTYNGETGKAKLYVDGEFNDEDSRSASFSFDLSNSNNPSTAYIPIGRRYSYSDDSGTYLEGNVSDVRMYDRALSPQEIQALYDWGNGNYASPPNNRTDSSSAVSRWKFDGDVTDSWGNNGGTDNTSAGFSSNSLRGKAKKFDGDDDRVDLPSYQQNIDGHTVAYWYRSDGSAASNSEFQYLFTSTTSSDTNGFRSYNARGNAIRSRIKDGSGNDIYVIDDGLTVPKNEWIHVAATFDGSVARVYRNGELRGQQETSSSDFTVGTDPYIGWWAAGGADEHAGGILDDVRLYSRGLGPEEVFQLYQWGTRGRDMRKLTVNSR
jgi:hypothetical protein